MGTGGRAAVDHRRSGPRGSVMAAASVAGLVLLLGACGDEAPEPPAPDAEDPSAAATDAPPEPEDTVLPEDDPEETAVIEEGPEEAPSTASTGTGQATVTVDGETSSFVVITCALSPDEDPSGLLEFGGSAVSPGTPSAVIAEALRGYAQDDGSDPDATMARNAENTETFLQYGPVFTWQRWLDADDLPDDLAFLAGDIVALALTETDAWLADSSTGFIERDGRSFRGSIDAVKIGEGLGEVADNLTFEATCP